MLTCLALLVLSSTLAAAEPIRDDIVDLRHGRLPNRRVFLGWTADDRAVVHVASCGVNDGGGPFCSSVLEVTDRSGTSSTVLLVPACGECDPYSDTFRYQVPTEVASKAIRAAAQKLAALGPLRASSASPTADARITRTTCSVAVAIGEATTKVSLGKDCIANGGSESIQSANVRDVHRSPDGAVLAITIAMDVKWMEWSGPRVIVKVVPSAPR